MERAGPADHPDNVEPETIGDLLPRVHVAAILLEQHETVNPKLLAPLRASLGALTAAELDEVAEMSPRFEAAARRHGIWPDGDAA